MNNFAPPACAKGVWDEDADYGVDGDPEGQKLRDALRARMYERCGIQVTNTNTTNPQMRYAESLEDVNIANFRSLGNSSYSGESLIHNPEYFELLYKSGIYRVIDLVKNPKVRDECYKYGTMYISYDMTPGYGNNPIFCNEEDLIAKKLKELSTQGLTKKEYDARLEAYKEEIKAEKDNYINNLAKLIDQVNNGHFYMACDCGDFRTRNCLGLISTFNPNWFGERIAPSSEYVQKFRNLFNNLTAEHRRILRIDEKLYEELGKYLKTL